MFSCPTGVWQGRGGAQVIITCAPTSINISNNERLFYRGAGMRISLLLVRQQVRMNNNKHLAALATLAGQGW